MINTKSETPAHRAAAYLARMVVACDERATEYAREILDTPEYAAVSVDHLELRPAEATGVKHCYRRDNHGPSCWVALGGTCDCPCGICRESPTQVQPKSLDAIRSPQQDLPGCPECGADLPAQRMGKATRVVEKDDDVPIWAVWDDKLGGIVDAFQEEDVAECFARQHSRPAHVTGPYVLRPSKTSPTPAPTLLFHRLWTKAVGTTGYVKAEWKELRDFIERGPSRAPLEEHRHCRTCGKVLAADRFTFCDETCYRPSQPESDTSKAPPDERSRAAIVKIASIVGVPGAGGPERVVSAVEKLAADVARWERWSEDDPPVVRDERRSEGPCPVDGAVTEAERAHCDHDTDRLSKAGGDT